MVVVNETVCVMVPENKEVEFGYDREVEGPVPKEMDSDDLMENPPVRLAVVPEVSMLDTGPVSVALPDETTLDVVVEFRIEEVDLEGCGLVVLSLLDGPYGCSYGGL